MAWSGTTLTSPSVGDQLAAAQGQAIAADLNVFNSPASYTPTLTSSGTSPTGQTYSGVQIAAGSLVVARGVITMSASVGTGSYLIAPPVTIPSGWPADAPLGFATYYDTSATTPYACTLLKSTSTAVIAYTNAAAVLGAATPVVVASGDLIIVNFFYITS